MKIKFLVLTIVKVESEVLLHGNTLHFCRQEHPQYAFTGMLLTKRIVAGLETLPVYDLRILPFTYKAPECSLDSVAFTDIILLKENNW